MKTCGFGRNAVPDKSAVHHYTVVLTFIAMLMAMLAIPMCRLNAV